MAHPADAAPKSPVFAHARLTPDEADRLASMFRPSWELDDAPFTGAGTMSDADMRALQGGGGVMADVRATALQAPAPAPVHTNGHAPPAPMPVVAQEASVVLDPTLTPAAPPQVHAGAKTMMGIQAPVAPEPFAAAPQAPAPVSEVPRAPVSRPSQRPAAPNFVLGPPTPQAVPVAARPAPQTFSQPGADVGAYPKKKSMGLWLGLGGAAVVLLGVGIWAVTSGGSSTPAPAATATATEKPTEDKLSAVPPPPPVTATTQAAATPPTPPAVTAPPTPPQVPATALPVAPATTHVAAAAPPPRPAAYPPPAAAPPHTTPPKKGQTIVRDVPF